MPAPTSDISGDISGHTGHNVTKTKRNSGTIKSRTAKSDKGARKMNRIKTDTGNKILQQIKEQASDLQGQASDRLHGFAANGKDRVVTMLGDFSDIMNDAATSVDTKLGAEYGEYARRAADAVSGLAETLRGKEIDNLLADGRNFVRKSPGVAIGLAALAGFTLVRLLKAGSNNDAKSTHSGD